jgi:hypothetical protein
MKKLAAALFLTTLIAISAVAQSAPTLQIVTETPGLPSTLFYGNVQVKPLRFRPGTNTLITINDYDFFVQQQYIDFLRRFPDASGMQFYLNILNGCQPTDTQCILYTRGAVSGNFFRSPEFQQKGLFVMYLYMVSIGQRAATVAQLSDPTKVERPHYTEFLADLTSISDTTQDLDTLKNALVANWLQRAEIQQKYGSLSNTQFVQTLEQTAGVTVSTESSLIAGLNNGSQTRAQVLRSIVESPEVNNAYNSQAFVTMEYFGYLRRDPEVCKGSSDPANCGYIYQNNRFTQLAGGDPNILQNFIIRGFIESPEYINRF